jgi:hypothetical protein
MGSSNLTGGADTLMPAGEPNVGLLRLCTCVTKRFSLRGLPGAGNLPLAPRPCLRAPHAQSRLDKMWILSHSAPRRA